MKKADVNKAGLVREALDRGLTKNSDIVDFVKTQGVSISSTYVSVVKSKGKGTGKKGRPGIGNSKTAIIRNPRVRPAASGTITREDIQTLADLVSRVGIEKLRMCLDVYDFLTFGAAR